MPNPFDKTMQGQMRSDAWRDAQRKLQQQPTSNPLMKRDPSQFQQIQPDKRMTPSGLATEPKPALGQRTAFQPLAQPPKFGQSGPKGPPLRREPEREFEFDLGPSGLKTAREGSGAGAVAGFQIPLGMQKRKEAVDEVLRENPDIGEGVALSFMSKLSDEECDQVGNMLDSGDRAGVADKMRMFAVRELVRQKVREVVRKKEGGGGYVLYAPNKGKKGKPRNLGTFPTKLGAKRAELARNPPKEPAKLQRLRKYVKRLSKKPQGDDEKKKKRESVIREAGTPFAPGSTQVARMSPPAGSGQIMPDVQSFGRALAKLPPKSPERTKFLIAHANDAEFMKKLAAQSPDQAKMLTQIAFKAGDKSAMLKPGAAKTTVQGGGNVEIKEHVQRRMEHMHRAILTKVITKSLTEAMFREETGESEWDEYISRLSKQALAGDGKFQSLQKNITRKTEDVLDDAFLAIRKALGKSAAAKNHGVKEENGTNYLMFSADIDGVQVGPIAIAIEGGKPRIHLSPDAKAALMKVEPQDAKMFRAELVTVQEAILDEMDDLAKATTNRDKYLQKLEGNVDAYVAGLSPLEISILKNLLVKKYRKIT